MKKHESMMLITTAVCMLARKLIKRLLVQENITQFKRLHVQQNITQFKRLLVQKNHIVEIFVQHGLGGSLATLELGSALLTTAMMFARCCLVYGSSELHGFLACYKAKQSKAFVVPDSMHCETMSLRS
jgi:hypothetical protein